MIQVDLSKAPHPRVAAYLVGLLPGLFLEISVALGNGFLLARYLALPLNRYILLAIAIIFAYIIGNAALMFVWLLIFMVFNPTYRLWRRASRLLWTVIRNWAQRRLAGTKAKRRAMLFALYERPFKPRRHLEALGRVHFSLVQKVVESQYGITGPDVKHDWQYWAAVLDRPSRRELRGDLLAMACQACGWAGLAAITLAPQLLNSRFVAFCIFLVSYGCLINLDIVRRQLNPEARATLRIHVLLNQLERSGKVVPIQDAAEEE